MQINNKAKQQAPSTTQLDVKNIFQISETLSSNSFVAQNKAQQYQELQATHTLSPRSIQGDVELQLGQYSDNQKAQIQDRLSSPPQKSNIQYKIKQLDLNIIKQQSLLDQNVVKQSYCNTLSPKEEQISQQSCQDIQFLNNLQKVDNNIFRTISKGSIMAYREGSPLCKTTSNQSSVNLSYVNTPQIHTQSKTSQSLDQDSSSKQVLWKLRQNRQDSLQQVNVDNDFSSGNKVASIERSKFENQGQTHQPSPIYQNKSQLCNSLYNYQIPLQEYNEQGTSQINDSSSSQLLPVNSELAKKDTWQPDQNLDILDFQQKYINYKSEIIQQLRQLNKLRLKYEMTKVLLKRAQKTQNKDQDCQPNKSQQLLSARISSGLEAIDLAKSKSFVDLKYFERQQNQNLGDELQHQNQVLDKIIGYEMALGREKVDFQYGSNKYHKFSQIVRQSFDQSQQEDTLTNLLEKPTNSYSVRKSRSSPLKLKQMSGEINLSLQSSRVTNNGRGFGKQSPARSFRGSTDRVSWDKFYPSQRSIKQLPSSKYSQESQNSRQKSQRSVSSRRTSQQTQSSDFTDTQIPYHKDFDYNLLQQLQQSSPVQDGINQRHLEYLSGFKSNNRSKTSLSNNNLIKSIDDFLNQKGSHLQVIQVSKSQPASKQELRGSPNSSSLFGNRHNQIRNKVQGYADKFNNIHEQRQWIHNYAKQKDQDYVNWEQSSDGSYSPISSQKSLGQSVKDYTQVKLQFSPQQKGKPSLEVQSADRPIQRRQKKELALRSEFSSVTYGDLYRRKREEELANRKSNRELQTKNKNQWTPFAEPTFNNIIKSDQHKIQNQLSVKFSKQHASNQSFKQQDLKKGGNFSSALQQQDILDNFYKKQTLANSMKQTFQDSGKGRAQSQQRSRSKSQRSNDLDKDSVVYMSVDIGQLQDQTQIEGPRVDRHGFIISEEWRNPIQNNNNNRDMDNDNQSVCSTTTSKPNSRLKSLITTLSRPLSNANTGRSFSLGRRSVVSVAQSTQNSTVSRIRKHSILSSTSVPLFDFGTGTRQHPLFVKASDQDLSKTNPKIMSKRIRKWIKILGKDGVSLERYKRLKAHKVIKYVRLGIPDQMRGQAWFHLSGASTIKQKNPQLYKRLCSRNFSVHSDNISRDVNRTYPSHVQFKSDKSFGQQSLHNILHAFASYDEEVGYVQGMGFIGGLLLMYLPEEDAFYTLLAIINGQLKKPLDTVSEKQDLQLGKMRNKLTKRRHSGKLYKVTQRTSLRGIFKPGLPQLRIYMEYFDLILGRFAPKIQKHFKEINVLPELYCSQWFLTLYTYFMPFDFVLRIWDIYMLEGIDIVFKVGLLLLKLQEQELLNMNFEDIITRLNHLRQQSDVFNCNVDSFISQALSFKVRSFPEVLQLNNTSANIDESIDQSVWLKDFDY